MNTAKIILGIAAGLAGGIVIGALFAPAKGSTTRRQIYRKAEDAADELKEFVEQSVDALSERYVSVMDAAMASPDKGKGNGNSQRKTG
jgi:gas vesicle protein